MADHRTNKVNFEVYEAIVEAARPFAEHFSERPYEEKLALHRAFAALPEGDKGRK